MAITVDIIASDTKEHSSVHASGSIIHTITDDERRIFGITDGPLKEAIRKYFGKAPNQAYVKGPTPHGGLYRRYGWPEVKTRLTVRESKILGLTSEPVILSSEVFSNKSNEKATFNAEITDEVSETVETNWSQTYGLEVGQTVSYGIAFSGVNLGGETSISYSSEFGTGGSRSQAVTVSATQGVSVEVPAHQSRKAQLSASRGTLKVQIVYDVTLSGDVAVNYNPSYHHSPTHGKHHFWGLPVTSVMDAGGIQTVYEITEVIEVAYYTTGKVTITDADK